MAFYRDFLGKAHFGDDESVELDCGCFADAGDDYYEVTLKVIDKDGNVKEETMTTCTECYAEHVVSFLENHNMIEITEQHVNSADDEYDDYQDYMADRGDDY